MRRYERALVSVTAVGAGATALAYATMPSWRPWIVGEDRILEMTTVVLLSAAAVIALVALLRQRGDTRLDTGHDAGHDAEGEVSTLADGRVPCAAVAGLAIVTVLDELSFGARIFDFEPPVVEGASLDAVHDLVLIGALFVSHQESLLTAASIVIVCGLAGLACAWWLWRSGLVVELLGRRFARFLAVAVGIAVVSTLIDLDQVDIPALQLWEELLETGGGMAIVLAALATRVVAPSLQPSEPHP